MNQLSSTPRLRLLPTQPSGANKRPELADYRPYTRALLRRYFRLAIDIGRLPSILGGLCFRARVSSYKLHTFEDAVIFVHDIERVLDRIERRLLEVIAGVIMLEYSIPEVALRMDITVQRAERRYAAALDALSAELLNVGLLRPLRTNFDDDEDDTLASESQNTPPRRGPQSERTQPNRARPAPVTRIQ